MSGVVGQLQTSDGLDISYVTWGAGNSTNRVMLLHGFISNAVLNWETTGLAPVLADAGAEVIGPDARGHGASGKPVEISAYSLERFAADVSELAESVSWGRFSLVGYSMGSIVAAAVAADNPKVQRVVLGGVGRAAVDPSADEAVDLEAVASALEADVAPPFDETTPSLFRAFAEGVGSNLEALAAAARGHSADRVRFDRIQAQTLIVVGEQDGLAQQPERLSEEIPNAAVVKVPGDHLSALTTPEFRAAIVAFLLG